MEIAEVSVILQALSQKVIHDTFEISDMVSNIVHADAVAKETKIVPGVALVVVDHIEIIILENFFSNVKDFLIEKCFYCWIP